MFHAVETYTYSAKHAELLSGALVQRVTIFKANTLIDPRSIRDVIIEISLLKYYMFCKVVTENFVLCR